MNYLIGYILLGLGVFLAILFETITRPKSKFDVYLLISILAFWMLWPFVAALFIQGHLVRQKYATRCAWCGKKWVFTSRNERAKQIVAHIYNECDGHPMRNEINEARMAFSQIAKSYDKKLVKKTRENTRLEERIQNALRELGESYPAPVANAVKILKDEPLGISEIMDEKETHFQHEKETTTDATKETQL